MERSCCELKLEMATSMKYYQEILRSFGIDENLLPIFVAVVVIILSAVIWRLVSGGKSRKSAVLLLGISQCGKSQLFSFLTSGLVKDTQISLKENEAPYIPNEKKKTILTMVDIPGQESIRSRFFDNHKSNALGILFVIDSEAFQKTIKDVAEFLFQILTDKTVHKSAPTLCIACNKQDLLMAKSKRVIQAQLEKELNTVRKTQSAALTSTSGGGNESVFLGEKGKDFQFQQLTKFKVQFIECNVKAGEEREINVDEVTSWIVSLV
uniref:Signal recognition particle receptor subunit beta n=1 Tax=Phallusia mammillata TaxID=59560 RepID=A0A6F9DU74_9ASCI|nr:signal recognition particle receptor subunit beta [Phallusia mammillata]